MSLLNIKSYFLFLFVVFLHFQVNGQVVYLKSAPKSISKLYSKAEKAIGQNKMTKAFKFLSKSIEKEPNFIDAHLKLAVLYYDNGEINNGIIHFEKARELDPYYDVRVWQALSVSYEKEKDYLKAAQYLKSYREASGNKLGKEAIEKMDLKIVRLEFMAEMLSNPVPFDPKPISDKINSSQHSEYLPSLTADGKLIFFTRVTNNQEDLYYSRKDEKGEWQEAEIMPNINTHENEGAHSISADGKTILFTYCSDGRQGKAYGCNIYISNKSNGKWSSPVYFEALNSKSWDSQPHISANGKMVIFTSKRKGGKGGSDLWSIEKDISGTWNKVENLGSVINTKGNEESPFFHPDGKKLYFKSDHHLGMGSFDLFVSELSANGTWSKPVNLGYPINTKDHEGALVISMDGKTAYYSRGNGKVNFDQTQTDLYTFELPEEHRAAPVGFVKIIVKDRESLEPLQAEIEIQTEDLGDNFVEKYTSNADGTLTIPIPIGVDYSMNVNQEGYVFFSDRFELRNISFAESAFEIEVLLDKIKIEIVEDSAPIVLKNVLFETASFELISSSYFELDKLLALLQENQDMKIEIRGHTDDIGDEEDNLKLSENRALAVRKYLESKGVASQRLASKGFGELQPIDDNNTEQGRKNNRRTEFVIIN